MKKILVTTDLSTSSRSALRFAIQLASQSGYSLTFFHSYHILRPTSWSDASFVSFENSESTQITQKLRRFVAETYKSMKIPLGEADYVAKNGVYAEREIMEFASKHNYSYICVSRKGHGKTQKLFGSKIASLIKRSKVPVIAIPDNYKRTIISDITYLSDLSNLDHELKKVTDFSNDVGAKAELLHFKVPIDYLTKAEQLNAVKDKLNKYNVSAHYETLDYEKTLIQNINKTIDRAKPSLLIMFTHQKRSLFERIFLSSISAEFSSMTKIPLLVFDKD